MLSVLVGNALLALAGWRAQPCEKLGPAFQAVLKALEAEELVGRVIILVGRGKAEEHGIQTEQALEQFGRRARWHPWRTRRGRCAIQCRQHRLRRGECGIGRIDRIGARGVLAIVADLDRHPVGQCCRRCATMAARTARRVLSGDEPAGDLGVGRGWDDGLRARARDSRPRARSTPVSARAIAARASYPRRWPRPVGPRRSRRSSLDIDGHGADRARVTPGRAARYHREIPRRLPGRRHRAGWRPAMRWHAAGSARCRHGGRNADPWRRHAR